MMVKKMGNKESMIIIIPLLVGIAIREAFAPFTGHPFDFELWVRLGYYVSMGRDPYAPMDPIPGLSMPGTGTILSIAYPPLWPLIEASLYLFYSSLQISSKLLYYFILKQPMIVADVVDALLIYRIISRLEGNTLNAVKAFRFWLFCPLTVIISSIWGMFDQIVLAFILISFLFLLPLENKEEVVVNLGGGGGRRRKVWKSSLSESLAILLKGIPVIFLPILAIAQGTRRKAVGYASLAIATSLVASLLPYAVFRSWSFVNFLSSGGDATGKLGGTMNYWIFAVLAYNYGTLPSSLSIPLKIIAYAWIPAVLFASYLCARVLFLQRRTEIRNGEQKEQQQPYSKQGGTGGEELILLSLLFVALVFLLTRFSVNEQYVVYFLGFALVDCYWLTPRRFKLFHGIWISTVVYVAANNSWFLRFLQPLSISFFYLDQAMGVGLLGEVRAFVMVCCALSFTIFSFLYLRSVYFDLFVSSTYRKKRGAEKTSTF